MPTMSIKINNRREISFWRNWYLSEVLHLIKLEYPLSINEWKKVIRLLHGRL